MFLTKLEKLNKKDILTLTPPEAFLLTVSKSLIKKHNYSESAAIMMIIKYHIYKSLLNADDETLSYVGHYSPDYWADEILRYYTQKELDILRQIKAGFHLHLSNRMNSTVTPFAKERYARHQAPVRGQRSRKRAPHSPFLENKKQTLELG